MDFELTAMSRVYVNKGVKALDKAHTAQQEMISAGEKLLERGVSRLLFSVIAGKHSDADVWDTAKVLRKHFSQNSRVEILEAYGDPFCYGFNRPLWHLHGQGRKYMLSISLTSVKLITPKVFAAMRDAFMNGAKCVHVVPPEVPTGKDGAANNQCTAWDVEAACAYGGVSASDIKPDEFNPKMDDAGVHEALLAHLFGPGTMAVILPDLPEGEVADTRQSEAQKLKLDEKIGRLNRALLRDGLTWNDLRALRMKGYPLDLRIAA